MSFVTTTLKRLINKIGLIPANYSSLQTTPHSFRRSGATFALQAGAPEHLLQLHGDWRSDAYKHYLSLPLRTHSTVADIMAAGLLILRSFGSSLSYPFYIIIGLFNFFSINLHVWAYPSNFLWGATLLLLSINRIFWPNVSSCLSLVSNFEFWLYRRGPGIAQWASCLHLHAVSQPLFARLEFAFPPSLPPSGPPTCPPFKNSHPFFGPNVSSRLSPVSNFEFWLYQIHCFESPTV